ncbi:hypothetical protein K461DRAFT_295028 [Myriangium duriaei CBS 260.36]|uniref:Uncharacterized protein n=1 Tax=Myriangium duriaei CBS 260.36 TaxID=1168546 RepID=A0A9P4IXY3_9PEZI|nr:hypothetical protein K461DRAFT_295028 [Myriangium duriaei CBS 260.36]
MAPSELIIPRSGEIKKVKTDILHDVYFCTYYLTRDTKRIRSPISGINATALVASCQCIVQDVHGILPSIPQQSSTALAATATSDSKSEVVLRKEYRNPRYFCYYENARPRTPSPSFFKNHIKCKPDLINDQSVYLINLRNNVSSTHVQTSAKSTGFTTAEHTTTKSKSHTTTQARSNTSSLARNLTAVTRPTTTSVSFAFNFNYDSSEYYNSNNYHSNHYIENSSNYDINNFASHDYNLNNYYNFNDNSNNIFHNGYNIHDYIINNDDDDNSHYSNYYNYHSYCNYDNYVQFLRRNPNLYFWDHGD